MHSDFGFQVDINLGIFFLIPWDFWHIHVYVASHPVRALHLILFMTNC